jgi:hypothetical protein
MPRVSLRHAALAAFCGVMLQSFALAAAFKGPSTFGTHLAPISVAVADFNQDGNLDLAVANRSSNDISVLLGKGNGTFSTEVKYSAGAGGPDPTSIAAVDLNGDGYPDIVVADIGLKSISVFINAGNGTFKAAVLYKVGNSPSAVAVGDLNGDGFPDIAVTNSADNTVTVLLNSGTGTFTTGGTFATDTTPSDVVIADFDGNGSNDLAITNQGSNDVSILLNQGSGTFAAAVNYCVVSTTGSCSSLTGITPVSLVAVPLHGGSTVDLAVASSGGYVSTLLNNGSGVFTLTAEVTSSLSPVSIAAGTFSGTTTSLVVADNTTNSFEIYANSNGNLGTPLSYLSGTKPTGIAVGDFNKDGKLDVAVTNSNDNDVAVVLGTGSGTFTDIENFISGGSPAHALAVGDFNGDNNADFLVNNSTRLFAVDLFTGNGKGIFTQAATVSVNADASSIAAADFNQDKKLDFVATQTANNAVAIVLGNGNGTFGTAGYVATDSGPVAVAAADLNGDGWPDIVTANSPGNDVSVLINTKSSNLNFNPAVNYPVGTAPSAVALGDLNNDGFIDIVVANSGSADVSVLLGKGDGTFQPAVTYSVGNGPSGITLAKTSGHIYPDIIVTNQTDSSVSVLLGNGDGTFEAATTYTIPNSSPVGVTTADINSNGILDLIVTESALNQVGVMQGSGTGTFSGAVNYKVGVTPVAVKATYDSGGKWDLLVANSAGGDVSALINQSPAAVMSATPTKLLFGNVQIGSTTTTQTVTLTNKGNTTLTLSSITSSADYNMTTTCGSSLASLGTCTITISFSPSFPGAINGMLTIQGSAVGDYLLVPTTGTGQYPMATSPATLTFPSTAVGKTSAGQTVTVINQSTVTQNFTFSATGNYNVVGSGASPCGSSLAAAAKCTVSVTLSPTQSGAINGSFIVTAGSGSTFLPQITSLSGTGSGGSTLPLNFNPTSLLFDSPALGFSSLPKTVTATNTTSGALNLTLNASQDWTVSGTGNTPCGGTLGAGATCQFAVVFTPSVLGYFNGSISIATGSGNPVIYDLEGLGNINSSFSPASMSFAPQAVGTTSPGQIVKVWNFQNTAMTIEGWSVSGDFAVVPGGTQPCSVGGQVQPLLLPFCNLVVYFTPTKTGAITGAVTVTTNWATGSESFAVSGTGQ